jgi:hypothetical protein
LRAVPGSRGYAAQVSNLLYRRLPVGRLCLLGCVCGLEIRDIPAGREKSALRLPVGETCTAIAQFGRRLLGCLTKGMNRGIRGIRGIRNLAAFPSAYSAYSAVNTSVAASPIRVRLSGREHKWCAASTATRLCNKAQGWTEGTTLGSSDGGAINPNGVVAASESRRLVFRPPGRNPVGVDGHCRAITQGWRRANPGLCCTTPLGLERGGFSLA